MVTSVHGCTDCLDFHIHTVTGSDKVEVKHQNVQTESVEIKDQHVQTKAIQIAATETTYVKLYNSNL